MEEIFTNVYENKTWGHNNDVEYNGSSGGGSDIEYNKDTYVPFLHIFSFKTPIFYEIIYIYIYIYYECCY